MDVIEWTHVESNQIVADVVDEIFSPREKNDIGFGINSNVVVCGECDPDYIKNYRSGKWSDYTPISSGVDGICPLKGDTGIVLQDPWLKFTLPKLEYDVCLQVSAGAKNDRRWRFDPLILAKILRDQGLSVVLVGTDPLFKQDDEYNLVGKLSLIESLGIISKSKIFIGLSGFLCFYAMSRHIKTVHYQISEEINNRYIHPAWKKIMINVEFGSIQEVLNANRKINLSCVL